MFGNTQADESSLLPDIVAGEGDGLRGCGWDLDPVRGRRINILRRGGDEQAVEADIDYGDGESVLLGRKENGRDMDLDSLVKSFAVLHKDTPFSLRVKIFCISTSSFIILMEYGKE